MDYLQMTAPCGLACFNCTNYLANENKEARKKLERDARLNGVPIEVMLCQGCRNQKGVLDSHTLYFKRSEPCYVYKCTNEKNINFCYECVDFPCDHLHPYSDRATKVPHNTKVFNLCLIKKMGMEGFIQKSPEIKQRYYKGKMKIGEGPQ